MLSFWPPPFPKEQVGVPAHFPFWEPEALEPQDSGLIFSCGISREIAAVGDTTSIPALMELDGGGGSSGFCLVCSIEFVCLMVTCP